jgi:uncharacterized FlgJ-related protein
MTLFKTHRNLLHRFTASLLLVLAMAVTAPLAVALEYSVQVWGSDNEAIAYWKQQEFWGAATHGVTLSVPRTLLVAINKGWKQEAQKLTVADKKELFYRSMLPLLLTANELILRDRERLGALAGRHRAGSALNADELSWLRGLAGHYRVIDSSKGEAADADILALLDELRLRVDIVPPGLALGQSAYESGYGTSRFALTGNALFGVWTWGEKGMKPQQQRKGKGNYGVAAYDWPFDSVRGYLLNLNTQRAYAELRRERAKLRQAGDKLTALALVGTLLKYSERGQAYVDTLTGIIKKNQLGVADDARLRDEAVVLAVSADSDEKTTVEQEIAQLLTSGEIDAIIESMRLELSR